MGPAAIKYNTLSSKGCVTVITTASRNTRRILPHHKHRQTQQATYRAALGGETSPSSSSVNLLGPAEPYSYYNSNGSGPGGRGRGYGGNGGGGSGGNGGGGPESQGGDDDSGPSIGWYLRAFAAMLSAVGLYVLLGRQFAPKRSQQASKHDSPAQQADNLLQPEKLREDVQALKRLQRETFEEFVSINTRLDALDPETNDPISKGADSTTHRVSMTNSRALVWHKDQSGEGDMDPSALAGQCGVSASLNLLLKTESRLQEGSLCLNTECSASTPAPMVHGSVGEVLLPLSLRKALLTWKMRDKLKIFLPLFGGVGEDMVPTLNPQADRGVTLLMRHGSGLHHLCRGSGVGATLSRDKAGLSLLHLSGQSGERRPSHSGSTLLQIAGAVTDNIMLGLHCLRVGRLCMPTALNQLLPTCLSCVSNPRANSEPPVPSRSQGLRYGVTGAWSLGGEAALSGWCSLGSDLTANSRQSDWGLTFGSLPHPSQHGWAVSFGRCAANNIEDWKVSPLILESSLHLSVAERIAVMPSLICSLGARGLHCVALALRCEWNF